MCGTDGGYKGDLYEYSSTYNVWAQRCDFPGDPRRSGVGFSIGSKGFCGTGLSVAGSKRDLYEYTPMAPIGFEDLKKMAEFILYPNPMQVSSTIKVISGTSFTDMTMKLFDLNGKLLREQKFSGSELEIGRDDLVPGIYFVSLSCSTGALSSSKLIIE